jgi:hypothetical protein
MLYQLVGYHDETYMITRSLDKIEEYIKGREGGYGWYLRVWLSDDIDIDNVMFIDSHFYTPLSEQMAAFLKAEEYWVEKYKT